MARGCRRRELSMFHHHALGCAGGSGCINDVGHVLGLEPQCVRIRVVHRTACQRRIDSVHIERHGRQPRIRQLRAQRRLRYDGHGRAVSEHEGQARARILRIDRHIGCASFQNAEDADGHIQRASDAQGNAVIGAYAARDQPVRQTICAGIQLCVAECATRIDHRRCCRYLPCPRLNERLNQRALGCR
jgi:Na+-translocating ferredoxin:NAD+ oxidoreductase RNF subunit RnfB